jgi:hypothetical protein
VFYPGWPAGFFFAVLVLGIAGYRLDQIAAAPYHAMAAGMHVRMVAGAGTVYNYHATRMARMPTQVIMVWIVEVAAAGALLMPAALLRLVRRNFPFPMAIYIGVQVALALLSIVGPMVTDYEPHATARHGPSGIEEALAWIPTCALCQRGRIQGWGYREQTSVLAGVSVFALLSMAVLLVRMWPAWREISKLEKTAASLEPAASPNAVEPAAAA